MKIEIRNLTKVYGQGKSAVVALNELDLEIQSNEICIVRGPNGSGKSTLISIVSGEIEQTVGEIKLDSETTPKISVVKQFNNLISELTIAEHFSKLAKPENQSLIPSDLLDRKPDQISRGQAQIVAIALALSSDTDLLLADEPTGALGQEESQMVYQFIQSTARKSEAAVILVTHDQDAEKIADQVVRLRDGRIGETWKPGEAERQVISQKGWVRIPEDVLNGMSTSVVIDESESGAYIEGRKTHSIKRNFVLNKRVSESKVLIAGNDISTRYGQTTVSSDLNFQINENDLFCIFGKSGIGKTTLLRTISGLHLDFSGSMSRNMDETIPYFNIEQPFGLQLSLIELGISTDLINKLNLALIAKRPLNTYSGGQLQRAIVAIGLSSTQDVIALDEPTSALDDEMANLVISALVDSPKTIILASHDDRLLSVASASLML